MKHMNRKILFVAGLFLVSISTVRADFIQFVPPTDPVGAVFSTNTNDAYSGGRGMAFEVSAPITITSVGLYANLNNVNLSFEVAQTLTRVGQVDTGETVLRSGSMNVTTSGLAFVDFSFAPLTLLPGNFYSIEFTHNGNGIQNFFYTQGTFGGNVNGIDNFNQDGFLFINGTQGGNTANFVIPAIRVNAEVPEPASLTVFGLLAAGGAFYGWRRRKLAVA